MIENREVNRWLGFGIVVHVAIIMLVYFISPVLVPLLISFCLYAILEPFCNRLEYHGIGRGTGSFGLVALMVVIICLFVFLAGPNITEQVEEIYEKWPRIYQVGVEYVKSLQDRFAIVHISGIDDSSSGSMTPEVNFDTLMAGSNYIAGFASVLALVPLFTFFLVKDFKKIRNNALNMLPNSYFELGWVLYYRVTGQLFNYIRGVTVQVLVQTSLTTIGYFLVGFESFVLLGIITGLLVMIPYLGLIMSLIPPAILAAGMTPFDPSMIVWAVIVVGTAHMIDSMFVVPTVIASAVNLHPLVVIIGVIAMGATFGIVGMILAIPLLASLKIIYGGIWTGLQQRPRKLHA